LDLNSFGVEKKIIAMKCMALQTDLHCQRQKIFHMRWLKQSSYLKMLLVLQKCILDVR